MGYDIKKIFLSVALMLSSAAVAQEVKPKRMLPDSAKAGIGDLELPADSPEPVVPGSSSVEISRMAEPLPRLDNPLYQPLPRISPYAIGRYVQPSGMIGPIGAFSSTDEVTGLMDRRSATFVYNKNIGRMFLSPYADYSKISSSFMGNHTVFSVGGTIGYKVNDWLTIGGFGQYTPKNSKSIMLYPFVPTTSYGGFVEVMFNEHWGAGAKVERELRMENGRWTWNTGYSFYPIYRK